MRELSEIRLPAVIDNLSAFISSVNDTAVQQGLSPKRTTEIELALEEALINIINYAYEKGPKGEIRIQCCLEENKNRFVIEIKDNGVPFDIFSTKEPDLSLDISEREIGGLGVFMIKKLMDEVTYKRSDTQNILTLAVDIH
jgi:serine/threonine-protein kinase RsbW